MEVSAYGSVGYVYVMLAVSSMAGEAARAAARGMYGGCVCGSPFRRGQPYAWTPAHPYAAWAFEVALVRCPYAFKPQNVETARNENSIAMSKLWLNHAGA